MDKQTFQRGTIETLRPQYMQQIPNQKISGGLLGTYNSSQVVLPMNATDWKKLSRETQIKVLEECGILTVDSATK